MEAKITRRNQQTCARTLNERHFGEFWNEDKYLKNRLKEIPWKNRHNPIDSHLIRERLSLYIFPPLVDSMEASHVWQ